MSVCGFAPDRAGTSLKSFLFYVIGVFYLPVIMPCLSLMMRKVHNIDDMVELAYSFHERLPLPRKLQFIFSIAPAQVKEEITELLRITAEPKPRTLLEIDTARGGTLFLFADVADPEAFLVLTYPGPLRRGYPERKIPCINPSPRASRG